MMYAPRSTAELPITTAQNWLQHSRFVLNPLMSCSAPKTSVSFACRDVGIADRSSESGRLPAVADARLNDGSAARFVSFAVAPDTVTTLASITTPANSQRRLPMYSHPPFSCAGSPFGGACSLPRLDQRRAVLTL